MNCFTKSDVTKIILLVVCSSILIIISGLQGDPFPTVVAVMLIALVVLRKPNTDIQVESTIPRIVKRDDNGIEYPQQIGWYWTKVMLDPGDGNVTIIKQITHFDPIKIQRKIPTYWDEVIEWVCE